MENSLTIDDSVLESQNDPGSGFGCVHLKQMLNRSAATTEKFKSAFWNFQRNRTSTRAKWRYELSTQRQGKETEQEPGFPVELCGTLLRSTHRCLQCTCICAIGETKVHSRAKGHTFYASFRSGSVFCAKCDDFIYDPELERIRDKLIQDAFKASKKRKANALVAPIKPTVLKPVLCRKGMPKGLYNLGHSCYLNVILQAMARTSLLSNYLLRSKHGLENCAETHCVACGLTRSLRQMLATDKEDGHGPVALLYVSWQKSSNLAGYDQQDAHEYFQFIVDQLHVCSGLPDLKNCDCIAHQTFSSELYTTVTCQNCSWVTTSSKPIIDLSLDVSTAFAQSKLLLSQASLEAALPSATAGVAVELKLTTGLEDFTTPENIPAEDGYWCPSSQCCYRSRAAQKHFTFRKLPRTLCIHLKRYENEPNALLRKLSVRVTFPLQLDMAPYTTRMQDRYGEDPDDGDFAGASDNPSAKITPASLSLVPHQPRWYYLTSVIVHLGTLQGGHYISYCRHKDQWFRFDDERVKPVCKAAVLAQEPYLLFYSTVGTLQHTDGL